MFTLQDLTKRYGLSERAIRRRVDALGTAIEPYLRRGPNNALLFSDGALAVLDRLAQLQRDAGLGLADAAAQVREELRQRGAAPAEGRPNSAGPGADPRPNPAEPASALEKGALPPAIERLLESYEARIESLERDKAYLQAKLDDLLARIPELPPPRADGPEPEQAPRAEGKKGDDNGSKPRRRVSRWRALRYALFGR